MHVIESIYLCRPQSRYRVKFVDGGLQAANHSISIEVDSMEIQG